MKRIAVNILSRTGGATYLLTIASVRMHACGQLISSLKTLRSQKFQNQNVFWARFFYQPPPHPPKNLALYIFGTMMPSHHLSCHYLSSLNIYICRSCFVRRLILTRIDLEVSFFRVSVWIKGLGNP